MDANPVFLYFTGGLGSCFGIFVLLYNLIALVLFLRERSDERPSALALTCWAIGVVALLFWWAPCIGGFAGFLAMFVARLERGRIYRDQAPLAGATPVRMAHTNGAAAIVLQTGLWMALLATTLGGRG